MAASIHFAQDFSRPLVISGPSGVGKSTLLQRLFAKYPDSFGFSVSHTTRNPRPGEVDGQHYHFVSQPTFKSLLADGAFMEHAEFSNNYYGTSFETVRHIQSQGKRCILDIEAQGVRQIKRTDLNPVYLFISPPDLSSLRARLQGRGTETEASVQKRLAAALKEISFAKEPDVHDFVIINDDLDRAYNLLERIARGEKIASDQLPPLDD
ncbi:guanylate kinase [Macrolepiota fuliginosa MF-IS2]|uniref:Guanylate kinase n=1 Tax=Macrolepiota fuliginosa MF-IS2 TaxID=1400762 RepID=A0A9P6BYK4_9AGAR|nr:guanylate kinase [Macrolepiota fuliginosa MF-IS2]